MAKPFFKPGARPQPAYGRLWARAWFPEIIIVFRKVCVCLYVCIFVCLYVYLFVFPHPREQTSYLKLESSPYTITKRLKKAYILHSRTGKFSFKGVLLSQSKIGRSDYLQTSKPAFLVDFSGGLQPKNSELGLMGLQGMHISSFGKWA